MSKEAKKLLSDCVRQFDLEARQRFKNFEGGLRERARLRKERGEPPTQEDTLALRFRGEALSWVVGGCIATYSLVAFRARNRWPKPGVFSTALKCTLGGFVGGTAGAYSISKRTIPEMLKLDDSSTADALCPSLAAFRPCLENRDCRQLLLDNTSMLVEWHELCAQRDRRLGRRHPNDGFERLNASTVDQSGGGDGLVGDFNGGGEGWGDASGGDFGRSGEAGFKESDEMTGFPDDSGFKDDLGSSDGGSRAA